MRLRGNSTLLEALFTAVDIASLSNAIKVAFKRLEAARVESVDDLSLRASVENIKYESVKL